LGVSPTTPRSRASPSPSTSPTTTGPVAIPTRAASGPGPGSPQPRDRLRRGQAHAHGALGVVLARLRPAEVGEHAVAEQLGHVAALRLDGAGGGAVIGVDDRAQVLGVEPGGEGGGACEVAEQHR
jgi:hypothetical protein